MAPQSPAAGPRAGRRGSPTSPRRSRRRRGRAGRPGRRRPRSRASATAGTATPGCRGNAMSRTVDADLLVDLPPHAGLEGLAGLDETGEHREPAGAARSAGGRAARGPVARPPSCTRQMTAGSVRGYSSCPAASQCRCPAPPRPAGGRAVRRAVTRAVSCQFSTATAVVEQARAQPSSTRAGHPQVVPSSRRVLAREDVGLATHRPVRHAVVLAEQHRALGGAAPSVARVRSRALPPRSQLPASPRPGIRRSARSVHATGVRPLVVDHDQPRGRPARPGGPGRCAASRRGTPRSAERPRTWSADRSRDAAERPQAGADHVRVADDHAGERRRREVAPRRRCNLLHGDRRQPRGVAAEPFEGEAVGGERGDVRRQAALAVQEIAATRSRTRAPRPSPPASAAPRRAGPARSGSPGAPRR